MHPILSRLSRRRLARLLLFTLLLQWTAPPLLAAQDVEPPTLASTISAIATTATNTFTDATLIGRAPSEFVDRYVRFVSAANPTGIVGRVKSFDELTGQFVLYESLPASAVAANDVYLLGTQEAVAPAIASADATDGDDAIVNIDALDASNTDVFTPIVTPPAIPVVGEKIWNNVIGASPTSTAIDGLKGADTIISSGPVTSTATAVVLPGVPISLVTGFNSVDVTSNGTATATGFAGGDDADGITNAGTLGASAFSTANGVGITLIEQSEGGGKAKLQGNVTSQGTATGISGGTGNDVVENRSTLSAAATTISTGVGVSAVTAVQNKQSASSSITATSSATATGILLGAGNDTATNRSGAVNAVADATATALNISIETTPSPPSGTVVPESAKSRPSKLTSTTGGGAGAKATATAIATDGAEQQTRFDPQLSVAPGSASLGIQVNQIFPAGNDSVTNHDGLMATATAGSTQLGVGVAVDGNASAAIASKANATATGVDLGGGHDTLTNTGLIDSTATASALAVDISVASKTVLPASSGSSTPTPNKTKVASAITGGATSTAQSTGVSADAAEPDETYNLTLTAQGDDDKASVGAHFAQTKTVASGNDDVTNSGTIAADAVASSNAFGVGATLDGAASAKLGSSATATAGAVDLGGGNDRLVNQAAGALTATATADAFGLDVAVGLRTDATLKGDIKAAVDGKASSEAKATGIAADGQAVSSTLTADLTADTDHNVSLHLAETKTQATGADVVENYGTVGATATATTIGVGVGGAVAGSASAKMDSQATAGATAIDLGGGDDTLTKSTGDLTATATSSATAVNIAVSAPFDSSDKKTKVASTVDGGATATSRATGVAGDGATADSTSDATLTVTNSVDAAAEVTRDDVALTLAYKEIQSIGDDSIVNDGSVTATADASTDATAIGVTLDGDGSTKLTSKADATATGLDLGGGNDTLTSSGSVLATATSGAQGLELDVSGKDSSTPKPPAGGKPPAVKAEAKSASDSSVTANSTAVGVSGDGTNTSRNQTATLSVAIVDGPVNDTVAVTLNYLDVKTHASGVDDVTNTGTIDANASSTTFTAAGGVVIDGQATMKLSSAATAAATAVDLGGGNDRLENTVPGMLTTTAASNAVGLAASIGLRTDSARKGEIKAAVDGSAVATSRATGVSADGTAADSLVQLELTTTGSQTFNPDETVTTTVTQEMHVALAETRAGGADWVGNAGAVSATATATSETGSLGVSLDGKGAANLESKANADATGVDLGAGSDTLVNEATGTLTSAATATANALNLAAGFPISGTGAKTKVEAAVAGGATATALATGVSADGAAVSSSTDVRTTIGDDSIGFVGTQQKVLGSGDDDVTNDGAIAATATSSSSATGATLAVNGSAAAKITSTATSTAVGIDLGAGKDVVTNNGTLTSTANATAESLNIAVGVSQSGSSGSGSGGSGSGGSTTGSTSASATAKPKSASSAADGSATAQARATGISGDAATADSTVTLSLTLPRLNDLEIDEDVVKFNFQKIDQRVGGDDTVTNTGAITVNSTADTDSGSIGFTIDGKASADSSSSADATAVGIDLGAGADLLTNSGTLTATAAGTARALSATVTNKGSSQTDGGDIAPKPAEGFYKGGVESKATVIGIDGSGASDTAIGVAIQLDQNVGLQASFAYLSAANAADGADDITNTGTVDLTATADSSSLTGSVTADGFALAMTHVKDEATATGIRGGVGDDIIRNLNVPNADPSTMDVTANSASRSITGTVSGKSAVSADVLWYTGTTVGANAIGLDGDGNAQQQITARGYALLPVGAGLHVEVLGGDTGGNDTITNEQILTVTADADTSLITGAISGKGVAAAVTSIETTAAASGIRGGSGDDEIRNQGSVTSDADAKAAAAAVTLEAKGVALTAAGVFAGGITASGTSVGIDGDGVTPTSTVVDLLLEEPSLTSNVNLVVDTVKDAAAGNDVIVNTGQVEANATVLSAVAGGAIVAKGISAAATQSVATADTAGIRGGAGDDEIRNNGTVNTTADATAAALNISINAGTVGLALAGNAVWNGGVKADATAVGLDADGVANSRQTITIDSTQASIVIDNSTTGAAGRDLVVNQSVVNAKAFADANSGAGAGVVNGLAAAISQSTANAAATAIRGGAGDDVVRNTGTVTAESLAVGRALNVTVSTQLGAAVAGNAVWDGGVKANATAIGIDGDGGAGTETSKQTLKKEGERNVTTTSSTAPTGNDVIRNGGSVTATATARTPTASVAVAVNGLAAAVSTSTATSTATAIGAGDGNDEITNIAAGTLKAEATSLAATANVAVVPGIGAAVAGDAVWDGGTTANATARGIDGGQGADTVSNAADVSATSTATGASADVAVAVSGVAGAIATSTAISRATALDLGADYVDDDTTVVDTASDSVTNDGHLTAHAGANALAAAVAVTTAGVAASADSFWDGGTTADAAARGIATGDGADTIVNRGAIDSTTMAITGVADVSVAVSGVAAALAKSTTTSSAFGIDAGAGDDRIDNNGLLTVTGNSVALSTAVGVTTAGLAVGMDAVWDGGTRAEASARGITAGTGVDDIRNTGRIDASANAGTASADVAVAVTGVAGAIASSRADADAIAIDATDGNAGDVISNRGVLNANALAGAGTVTVGVTTAGAAVAGDSSWDGGTSASATTRTIATGGGDDHIRNDGDVTAWSSANTLTVPVSVAVGGVAAAVGTSSATSNATAIDAGAGDDTIGNVNNHTIGRNGTLTADAIANAGAAVVSVTPAGVAVASDSVWDGGTKANATARGIDTGVGTDRVNNGADMVVTSTARTLSASVAVAVAGVAAASATSTSTSRATAIDSTTVAPGIVGGVDTIFNTAYLQSTANAFALAAPVSVTLAGVSGSVGAIWDGGTTADATARGIATSGANDSIVNSGKADAVVHSTAGSAAVSVAVAGVAAAIATSTAKGDAAVVDTGAGDDTVTNSGLLKAQTTSLAGTVTVGVTPAGVSVAGDTYDGGTHGDAVARTISTGGGADLVRNDGNLTADATAGTASLSVSVAVAGVGGAAATSTAVAAGAAIDAGAGDDRIFNSNAHVTDRNGTLTTTASATAVTPTVAVTPFGVSAATDAIWDGGTTAAAAAAGIDAGLGNDAVVNGSLIDATADANTVSVTASVNVFGVATSTATSTSLSSATAVETGLRADTTFDPRDGADASSIEDADAVDADIVENAGQLKATANSTAVSAGVGFTFGGLSVAGGALWDGGTYSSAIARGLSTGVGVDSILNTGLIDATADALSDATSASIAVFGVTAAASTASASARSTAIDAGDGDDLVSSLARPAVPGAPVGPQLVSHAEATGVAVNVGLTLIGAAAAADVVWNGGTQADATAVGITGGAGIDRVGNAASIGATADANTASIAVTVAGIGAGGAVAASTATATATALDGGDDADVLLNTGTLEATSTAHATAVAVTVTGGGVGVTGATWENGTSSNANAFAIGGGAGDDVIQTGNTTITARSTSETHSTAVGLTLVGVAGVAVGSTANADSAAIAGGDGDDRILADGTLVSDADATANGVGVSVTVGGVSSAGAVLDNVTRADANGIGVDGGAGADRILSANTSRISFASRAETTDTAVAVSATGVGVANASALSIANATGLGGGAGDDVIEHNGSLSGVLTSDARARQISVGVFAAGGGTGSRAETSGTGIDGGDGNDVVTNLGQLRMNADTTAFGQSVSVSTFAAIGGAGSSADALLVGAGGGAGNDAVVNDGTINLLSNAGASGSTVNIGLAGASVADSSTDAVARATGLAGGDGLDVVTNRSMIHADVDSTATVRSTGVIVAGASLNRSNSTADASAIGADGGADDDVIVNEAGGTIDLSTTAATTATNAQVTVFGGANGGSLTQPTAGAVGLSGGSGDDTVANNGVITIDTRATSSSKGSSTSIAGSARADVGTVASVTGTGIAGGDGGDRLLNANQLTLTSGSTTTVDGSSWTLAGVSGDTSTLLASGRIFGISGDAGNDWIRNEGPLTLRLESGLTIKGTSTAVFGKAANDSQLTADTKAFGLAGGAGADFVENAGRLDVTATAKVTSNKASLSLAGSPTNDALLISRSSALGFDGGDAGGDAIANSGAVYVNANADASVTGATSATITGGGASNGTSAADARGVGVLVGSGSNTIVNAASGLLDVTATGDSIVTNDSQSGVLFPALFGTPESQSFAKVIATADAIKTGHGDNDVTNQGGLVVRAVANGYGLATASGAHAALEGDADAKADATATAIVSGVNLGNGRNTLTNLGALSATAIATTTKTQTAIVNICSPDDDLVEPCRDRELVLAATPVYASANGNGATGDGVASSYGTAIGTAYGVQAGSGSNAITNHGNVTVTAAPQARSVSFADGDLGGNATATSEALSRATSVGILAGSGANSIVNAGVMAVNANPLSQADVNVTGGDLIVCIKVFFLNWCGGADGGAGTGTAKATFDASATGILVGDGSNHILNTGELLVGAAPEVDTFAVRIANADSATRVWSTTSSAVGIQTGKGNNEIVNGTGGLIDVEATDSRPLGFDCIGSCPSTVTAYGIRSGSGNDVIVNQGEIRVTRTAAGVARTGIAIDAGAGNDRVVLAENSTTGGTVILGAGNDRLAWSAGATVSDIVDGGAGTADVFALGGSTNATLQLASLDPTFKGFELFAKEGPATWTLAGNRAMSWTVEQGTLAVRDTITGTIDTSASGLSPRISVLSTGSVRRSDGAAAVVIAADGQLANDGLVEATGNGRAVETVGPNATVANTATIRAAGVAVEVRGNDNALNNTGLVQSSGSSAAVLITADGSSVVNNQAGVILSTGGVAVQGGTFNDTVTNHGRLTGGSGVAVDLGDGSDTLVVGVSSVLDGYAQGGAGFDTMMLQTAQARSFDMFEAGTVYRGFENYQKQGAGTLTLTGRGTLDWSFDEGALAVDGALTGTITTLLSTGTPSVSIGSLASVTQGAGPAAVVMNGGASLLNAGQIGGNIGVSMAGAGNQIVNQGQIQAFGATGVSFAGTGSQLENQGLIQATGSGSTGVSLSGAGNRMFNHGLVESLGGGTAVSMAGTGNQIVNHGQMRSSETGGIAVVLTNAGNQLENQGLIQATGSGSTGVSVAGAGNQIVNQGQIQAFGATGVSFAGTGNQLENQGLISGGTGVSLSGAGNRISNHGLIQGGIAVSMAGAGNQIVNHGQMRSSETGGIAVLLGSASNQLENQGLIQAGGVGGTGVSLGGVGNQIFNRGQIQASGIGGIGVLFAGSNNFMTNGGGVDGADAGIVMTGAEGTLINSGILSGNGSGVRMSGGGNALLNSAGGIVRSLFGPAVGGGAGQDLVENHGLMASASGTAIDLAAGDDLFVLGTDGRVDGAALGGTGFDALLLRGPGASVLTSSFDGFELMQLDGGGNWKFAGSGDMAWDVRDGNLSVDGSLLGIGQLAPNTTLSGTGTVGGFFNGGSVAPGNSIGTLRVAGDYQQGADATLSIETNARGSSDQLAVRGTAILDGTLEITPSAERYGIATEYNFITAGAVGGAFAHVVSHNSVLDPLVERSAQGMALVLMRNDVSFARMAATANTEALGAVLDSSKRAMARGDFKATMDQFLELDDTTRRASLTSLTGELHATTVRSLLRTGDRFFAAAVDRRSSAQVEGDRRLVWTDVVGFSGSVNGDGNAASASYRATGLVGGVDFTPTDSIRFGGSIGYSPGTTTLNGSRNDEASTASWIPAAYAEYDNGAWSLAGGAGFGSHSVRTERGVQVGTFDRQARASYDANQYSGLLRSAVSLPSPSTLLLRAFGVVRYSTLSRDAISEGGASSLTLANIAEARSSSLRTLLGVRSVWSPKVWNATVKPEVSVAWSREAMDLRGELNAGLDGTAQFGGLQRFSVFSPYEARDGAVVSLGASTAIVTHGSAYVTYDGNLSERGSDNGFSAGVKMSW